MKTPKKIEVQILRCSACDKTFPAVPSSGAVKCPHCGEEYVHDKDGWQCKMFMDLNKKRDENG